MRRSATTLEKFPHVPGLCGFCHKPIPPGNGRWRWCSRKCALEAAIRVSPGVARWEAIRRDGRKCVQCGSTKGLEVHHIHAVKDGGAFCGLDNLVTLCHKCHVETRKKPRPPKRQIDLPIG
jgi:5-methylcytosine-specific restriction endonuclease McrA